MFTWSVQKVCENQREKQGINDEDILKNGLYHKVNTKNESSFDRFNEIYNKRNKTDLDLSNHFVVQLRGCVLDCNYCPLTNKGIIGSEFKFVDTEGLIKDYATSGCNVFHLSGGAPAIYLNHWYEIVENLDGQVFYSDLMLNERLYKDNTLKRIAKYKNALYVINIKGVTSEEYLKNTGKELDYQMFWANLDRVVDNELPFYFTFTNIKEENFDIFRDKIVERYGNSADAILEDAYAIELS